MQSTVTHLLMECIYYNTISYILYVDIYINFIVLTFTCCIHCLLIDNSAHVIYIVKDTEKASVFTIHLSSIIWYIK